MQTEHLGGALSVDLEKTAKVINITLPAAGVIFAFGGIFISFFFHFLTVTFFLLTLVNIYYLYGQKRHTLLANFGLVAQLRYMIESLGPEFRQYLFLNDNEEKPFNRIERSEVYRKAKGQDSSLAFGSQLQFDRSEIKLRHSMFPIPKEEIQPYALAFGAERGIPNAFSLGKPILISAMSYGALGENAVRALARGARKAGILMNTGEGGYPKYHLMENCDLIFQMGTAKFSVRNEDGSLNDDRLREIAGLDQVRMIEIKLSQGAKPGKGLIGPGGAERNDATPRLIQHPIYRLNACGRQNV